MIEVNKKYYNIEVDEVLHEINLIDSRYFRDIKQAKQNIMTNCPIHGEDNKPSFGIRKDNGLCHCLSCGYKNTFTGLMKDLNMLSIFDSQEIIEKSKDITLFKGLKKHKASVNMFNPYKAHKTQYWATRGVSESIVELFDLGFDTKTQSVTFPMKNLNGDITGYIKRSVKTKWFHIDEGMDKIIYGMFEILLTNYKSSSIIVTESNIDTLYLWSLGYPSISLNGIGSEFQYNELNKYGFRKYYLMLDSDKAGRRGDKRFRENVNGFKITVNIKGGKKDVNEMTKEEIEQALSEVNYGKK